MAELVTQQRRPELLGSATVEVRVRSRWNEAQGIVALELVSANDTPLPPFDAGSFIDVELPNGQIRPYSLANAPRERNRYLLAVLLEPAGNNGSRDVHASIRTGDSLRVSAPRNAFPLHGGAIHSVLLAGGIGVTPLLSMAEHLWHNGASFELHYCFHTLERAAFVQRLSQAPYRSRVHLWCGGSGSERRFDVDKVLAKVPRLSHVYACGPTRFMRAAHRSAMQAGWHCERFHQESFDHTAS